LSDVHHGAGHEVIGFVPGHPYPVIFTSLEKAARGQPIGLPAEAFLYPLLPAPADHGILDSAWAINAASIGQAFQTTPGVPGGRGLIAVQVSILGYIIRLLDAGDDVIAHHCPKAAVVGIIGSTDEGEGPIEPVLVPIDPLPVPIRVEGQGVVNFFLGLQKC
jgi:hypothetical protein